MTRESAAPGDLDYLLRDIEITPLRFRVKGRARSPSQRSSENGVQGLPAGGCPLIMGGGGVPQSIPSSPIFTGGGGPQGHDYSRVNSATPALSEPDAALVAYVRDHPGAHMNDLRTHVPALGEWSYGEARAAVVRMVDLGVLEPCGQAPLEELDLRYERVLACDLCGAPSAGHKVVLWKHNTPVVRCSRCGLLYANPRWKAEHLFGRYDSEYWEHYAAELCRKTSGNPANPRHWAPYLRDLEPARRTGRLLDIGCATGEFLAVAKGFGWETYGVETSPQAAARAETRSGSRVHVGTLDTAPYPDRWFDAVTLWDVIEHVQSPRAYVRQIARLLRPGGLFALTTPNIGSIAFRLIGRAWWVVGPNDHIYYFAPGTLKRLLARSGFVLRAMQSEVKHEPWRHDDRYPALRDCASLHLAPRLKRATEPLVRRLLLGEELYAVASRVSLPGDQ